MDQEHRRNGGHREQSAHLERSPERKETQRSLGVIHEASAAVGLYVQHRLRLLAGDGGNVLAPFLHPGAAYWSVRLHWNSREAAHGAEGDRATVPLDLGIPRIAVRPIPRGDQT